MSFTTVDEVALYLNRQSIELTTLERSQVEMVIPFMDGLITNYCGWNLLATDYTNKRFDGTGLKTLDLRMYPINSLTQVRVRANDGTFTDVTTGVETFDDGVISFLPYATTDVTTFTAGTKNWFLTFNAGYAPGSIPHDLAYSATLLVVEHFNKIIDENTGLSDEKFEGITFQNANLEIPPSVKRMLDRYRLVSII